MIKNSELLNLKLNINLALYQREQDFKDFIIANLGIITKTEDKINKHVKISLDEHKDFLKIKYNENIWWTFRTNTKVSYLAFWSRRIVEDVSEGIYPIFYYYEGMKNNKVRKFLILSFGQSVKNKPLYSWYKNLPLISIEEYFKNSGIENLPLYNDELNYGNSQIYKIYSLDNNEISNIDFQNKVYDDFIKLLEYYLYYAKWISYEKNKKDLVETKKELTKIHKKLSKDIINTLDVSKDKPYLKDDDKIKAEIEEISDKITFDEKENISEEEIKKIDFPLNTILFGPPGTGKTYNARRLAVGIVEKDESYLSDLCSHNDIFKKYKEYQKKNINFITFHQSYSYEDFIEGIRPKLNSNETKLDYELNRGIFKELCDEAKGNKNENFVLVIDEINRGNISKIFGELISLIEPSKRLGEEEELKAILPYSGEEFGIPNNLYIIGTMNSSDKSVANFDNALRRRFNFLEITPQYSLLKDIKIEDIELDKLLIAMNEKIEFLIDKEHLLGQSYFMKVKDIKELGDIFKKSIIPLLEEYFYDDYEKIRIVLGSNKMINYEEKTLSYEGKNYPKRIYKINKDFFENPNVEEFKKIYLSDNEAK